MYLILEDAVRKSLVEKKKGKENFNTSLLENKEEREKKSYDKYNIGVNVNLDSILIYMKNISCFAFTTSGKLLKTLSFIQQQ